MSVTFPDNDKRTQRLIQLAEDAKLFLFNCQENYKKYNDLCNTINDAIAAAYRRANLTPPELVSMEFKDDIDDAIKKAGIGFLVSKTVIDVVGIFSVFEYLRPGVVKLLVYSDVITAQTATHEVIKFTWSATGKEWTIETGDILGVLIGGVIGGAVIAGIDIALDAIEGAIARDKLRDGINKMFPIRSAMKLADQKTVELLSSLQGIKTSLDALAAANVVVDENKIKDVIEKVAKPSIEKAALITLETVKKDLQDLDTREEAWTNEDPTN